MKVCYRPQRGGFNDAMLEKREFRSTARLKLFLAGKPTIQYYSRDSRLEPASNGDTFLITDSNIVIGYMWYEEGEANETS